ncbi:RNA-directed DNA polymerase [Pseudomonas sp. SK]|uniref:antiviral reverse transcriptase Drt3b n=1 Tax=Pseudomonas sp. SK TaxID=2729423 RepID=UPI0014649734|nr:antiviral reverse transcriptase Drt3b [Pseudomonas sp. SK]QJQ18646.1 RNA-directed DNA polymerase [Pseudomonas sp. SK]
MRAGFRRVKKEDFSRVVLTETCPYEVPIIFSNLGFYWHLKKHETGEGLFPDVMEHLFCRDLSSDYTIPLSYKIRKNESSFRTLSLLHPRAQFRFVEFYKTFGEQVIFSCTKSSFSIRHPNGVASKYYTRSNNDNISKYRSNQVVVSSAESRTKYLSSYFSYSGYTRLYRFFESYDFLQLERQYSSFWSVDISKFFDSIYTHSITWALKTKEFSKNHSAVKNSFGAVFDRLMQASNYNETAGIVIGPEVCRVFAEVIFQQIDSDIQRELSSKGLVVGRDYTVRRYVDDVFIFAISDHVANNVYHAVETHAKKYKLNINKEKTVKATRPFVTEKTKSLKAVKYALAKLIERLLPKTESSEGGFYVPHRLYNRRRVAVDFIGEVKSACIGDPESYGVMCGYLMSALTRVLTQVTEKNISRSFEGSEVGHNFFGFYHVLIEIIFHLFAVNPSHVGSVKIFIASTLSCSFFEAHLPGELNSIKSKVYTCCRDFFESSEYAKIAEGNNDHAMLEALNLLVVLKGLGSNYLLPRDTLQRVVNFSAGRPLSYFEIVVLLYYVESIPSYAAIKKLLLLSIKERLDDLSDIRSNAEKIYLFLDVMTCPFVEDKVKSRFAVALYKQINGKNPTPSQALDLMLRLSKYPWFVSWKDADFLSSLEKKELLKGY